MLPFYNLGNALLGVVRSLGPHLWSQAGGSSHICLSPQPGFTGSSPLPQMVTRKLRETGGCRTAVGWIAQDS